MKDLAPVADIHALLWVHPEWDYDDVFVIDQYNDVSASSESVWVAQAKSFSRVMSCSRNLWHIYQVTHGVLSTANAPETGEQVAACV